MTLRTPRSGIPPSKKKPPIAEELEKLREKPPRTSNRQPLSRLERLAILDGLKDSESPARIGNQWNLSKRTVREFKSRLYDDPLSLFHYGVIDHRGKGMYQCVFCGESKPRLSTAQRHVLAHFFAHHIAQNIDLADIPEVFCTPSTISA